MKGIVFNLLEQVVSTAHGEEVWDTLLEDAGLEGAYTAVGSYPDGDLFALVGAACKRLDLPADAVIRWFGRNALPLLRDTYPAFFEPFDSTKPFLLTLNDVIHPEVRKLFAGADVPEFGFDDRASAVLAIEYQSHRKLCHFGEGLILGAADHFGEEVNIIQEMCMHNGDPNCVLVCSFTRGEHG
jgi:hypothetical protein